MMFRIGALLIAALGLAVAMLTLSQDDVSHFLAGSPESEPVAVQKLASPPEPKEREVSVESELYSFDYVYPAQAAAIPELGELLERKIVQDKARVEAEATESRKDAKANGFPFQPHYFDLGWRTSADLPGWLGLQAAVQTYGGGAHPNHDFDSLVWDRRTGKAHAPLELFVSAEALDRAVHQRYCAALDKERAERRDQSVEQVRKDGMWECPGVSELVIALESSGGKGFDKIVLLAAPYIAGPYVEGSYVTEVAVDGPVLAAVRPEYREAFRKPR
ncbi:MAG: DUF4163 domain-containing protein [Novosphingobium sp.]|nr:DUF4163 domain-containing protein [Novosphingobium sp.]